MREIRTSGSTSGEEETELWRRLRHRHYGESRRQQLLPRPGATAPLLDSTVARRDDLACFILSCALGRRLETSSLQKRPHGLRPRDLAKLPTATVA